ncbi:MAG: nitrous oxide-stimulated promoter family protein [Defluviitaleaceae bacterium]|nr:nitrous oxide-stimulated promoter family protein [Defluviitaleaceae bacterium]
MKLSPTWQKELKWKKETVKKMVFMYCRKNHATPRGLLCGDCKALLTYANARADHCTRIEEGTPCRKCPKPCYKPDMKEKMRNVMRWAGPRMLLRHPITAIRYISK